MASKVNQLKIIVRKVEKISLPNWLIVVIVLAFIFRIPSFFEPYSYGDEMIYLTLGNAIRKGMVLYKDVHDNKPPLLYFLAAIAGNVFWFRMILAVWVSGTIVVFWKLVEELFEKEIWVKKISVLAFAILSTIPTFEGQIANSEIFMMGPTILAFYIALRKKATLRDIFISGILISVATLFKMPALFDSGALVLFWILFLKFNRKSFGELVKKILVFGVGFLGPIALTFIWYYLRGALHDYLVAAFLQNVGYLSSFRPGDVTKPFFVRNGPLLIRGGIVLIGFFVLYIFKKKLSKAYLFTTLWLLCSTFAMTLSERPYPHYILQVVPSLSIFFGMLLARQNIEQVLVIVPMTLFVIPINYYHFWYYPSLPYYQRFLEYAAGRISYEDYLNKFNGNLNRNYKVSQAVDMLSNKNDKVFVWGDDSSLIYALSKRLPPIKYVADYHIKDFSTTEGVVKTLEKKPPKLIVILNNKDEIKIDNLLLWKYNLALQIGGVEIWRRSEI